MTIIIKMQTLSAKVELTVSHASVRKVHSLQYLYTTDKNFTYGSLTIYICLKHTL